MQFPFTHGLDSHSSTSVRHPPLAGLQLCPAGHTTGGATQFPVSGSQASRVHRLLSRQVFATFAHPVAGLQLSAVQRLLSSQLTGGCVFRHRSEASQASIVQAYVYDQLLAEVSIPAPSKDLKKLATASVLQGCKDPTDGKLGTVAGDAQLAGSLMLPT